MKRCFMKWISIMVMMAVLAVLPGTIALADTQTVTKTYRLNFSESPEQDQSQIINLPNLVKVDGISTNTGNVSYTQKGNQLTVNVSNGATTRTNTPSKTVTDTADQYNNSSFPSTKSYNDGTYSGTLNKSGSPAVISGGYAAASSKYVNVQSGNYDTQLYVYCYADTLYRWGYTAGGPPSTYSYNDGTYSGTLSVAAWNVVSQTYTGYYYDSSSMRAGNYYNNCNQVVNVIYGGTVNSAGYDTRTWRQSYSGIVYAATQNYYSYSVLVTYEAQYEKPDLTVTVNNVNSNALLNWTMSDATQTYSYSVYRKSSSDAGYVKVVDGLSETAWTDCSISDTMPPGNISVTGVSHSSDFSQYTVAYTSSTDIGNSYQYYVEATGQKDGTKIQSTSVSASLVSGVKGYCIVVDNAASTNPTTAVTTTAQKYSFATPTSSGFYVHICAIDNAGNQSAVTHYHVDDTISVSFPVSVNYTIDPNTGTFIAPDIPVTNNSTQPVRVLVNSLKAVGGGSTVLHDVLPSKYSDWSSLTAAQTQSDIALGIGIKSGNTSAWDETDVQNPLYAAQITSGTQLGILKSGAVGNFQLTAKYGIAWPQVTTSYHQLELSFSLQ